MFVKAYSFLDRLDVSAGTFNVHIDKYFKLLNNDFYQIPKVNLDN